MLRSRCPTRPLPGRLLLLSLSALLVAVVSGCSSGPAELIVASTTSTQDSGLFDVLLPAFEEEFPEYEVSLVAVGTGAALEMGRSGDADVLLVHAEASEEEFVADGYGTERHDVMYNDFVLVGWADDPAGIAEASDAADAFSRVADSASTFVSRGDDSGTHRKEMSLWEAAGIEPAGDWYLSAGQGMGDVLNMASEELAYALTDRATFLKMEEALDVEILFEGDPDLFNQYGVIPVTDATNPTGAEAFAEWVTGTDAQELIRGFGVEEYGQPLFVPNA